MKKKQTTFWEELRSYILAEFGAALRVALVCLVFLFFVASIIVGACHIIAYVFIKVILGGDPHL